MTAIDVDRIYRLSEGWPAALQLYRLSVADPAVRRLLGDFSSARPRELVEYLADNVLAMQPEDVQEFLLRTSLLTRLNARLCDAVTGRTDSASILSWLERSGAICSQSRPSPAMVRISCAFRLHSKRGAVQAVGKRGAAGALSGGEMAQGKRQLRRSGSPRRRLPQFRPGDRGSRPMVFTTCCGRPSRNARTVV